jgi:hypothetical protein
VAIGLGIKQRYFIDDRLEAKNGKALVRSSCLFRL